MVRVRTIIEHGDVRAALVRLLPADAKAFAAERLKTTKSYYPTALIAALPGSYSDFGLITELLLRMHADVVDADALFSAALQVSQVRLTPKVLQCMPTQRYLDNVRHTWRRMNAVLRDAICVCDEVLCDAATAGEVQVQVQGHPDMMAAVDEEEDCRACLEIKTSGKPATDWTLYLLQVFAYAVLSTSASTSEATSTRLGQGTPTSLHLVLPLQETVWTYPRDALADWVAKSGAKYLAALRRGAAHVAQPTSTEALGGLRFGTALCRVMKVGRHVPKEKGPLVNTLRVLASVGALPGRPPMHDTPFQLFLNGNLSTKLSMDAEERRDARAFLCTEAPALRVFCHLPYTLALSNHPEEKDGFVATALREYLTCVRECGLRGGVVHVGKSNRYPPEVALDHMRRHILDALPYASPEAPLLLETPAGAGSELLACFDDFLAFVDSIDDPRLGICVDTCHVFSAGEAPDEYLARIASQERWLRRLKLIHFNDSKADCGDCVDRHAPIGGGKIAQQAFLNIVALASVHQIPMVVE